MKETNKRERSSQKSQTNQTERTEKSSTRKSERSQKNQRSQDFEDCDKQLRTGLNEGKEEVENVGELMVYYLFFYALH